jgi:16S rRNA (guanine527-N7)-methyltransferase
VSASREFRERLRRRAKLAGVALSAEIVAQLESYYQLLARWNVKVNLTAFRLTAAGEDEAIDRLLIEPMVAARHIPTSVASAIDAGTGGGSPAIPLKLAVPRLTLRMVEAKTRKSVFLREAVRTLGLTETTVETARFEELLSRPELHEAVDLVTVRAVRLEPKVLMTLQAFLRPRGHLFLFRGSAGDPAEAVTPPLVWEATFPLVASLHSKLVVLTKTPVGRR